MLMTLYITICLWEMKPGSIRRNRSLERSWPCDCASMPLQLSLRLTRSVEGPAEGSAGRMAFAAIVSSPESGGVGQSVRSNHVAPEAEGSWLSTRTGVVGVSRTAGSSVGWLSGFMRVRCRSTTAAGAGAAASGRVDHDPARLDERERGVGRNLGFSSIGRVTTYRVACIGEEVRASATEELVSMPLKVSGLWP